MLQRLLQLRGQTLSRPALGHVPRLEQAAERQSCRCGQRTAGGQHRRKQRLEHHQRGKGRAKLDRLPGDPRQKTCVSLAGRPAVAGQAAACLL